MVSFRRVPCRVEADLNQAKIGAARVQEFNLDIGLLLLHRILEEPGSLHRTPARVDFDIEYVGHYANDRSAVARRFVRHALEGWCFIGHCGGVNRVAR